MQKVLKAATHSILKLPMSAGSVGSVRGLPEEKKNLYTLPTHSQHTLLHIFPHVVQKKNYQFSGKDIHFYTKAWSKFKLKKVLKAVTHSILELLMSAGSVRSA